MGKNLWDNDPGAREMAEREALRSLLRLTVQDSDPELYHNSVSVSAGARKGQFGEIASQDVDGLLEPYISRGLVKRARVKYHTPGKGRHTTGYQASLGMIDGIEMELQGEG